MTPLRKARLDRQLTLNDVAKATGIDPGNLSRLETLKQTATPDVAEKLVAFYGPEQVSELQVLYPRRFMAVGDSGHDGEGTPALAGSAT